MRSERNMIRALVRGRTFRPGLTFAEGELAATRTPTVLVYGTEDPTAPLDVWKRFARLLPHGELRLIEGAGHLPWLDQPTEVATAVGRFLRAE